MTNFHEHDGHAVTAFLGEGVVDIEEIIPEKGQGFVRGNFDIRYQAAENPALNGYVKGNFKVLYCGDI